MFIFMLPYHYARDWTERHHNSINQFGAEYFRVVIVYSWRTYSMSTQTPMAST